MIKLSELKDDEKLIYGNKYYSDVFEIIEANDVKKEPEKYRKFTLHTTTEYKANLNAVRAVEWEIDTESDDMYEDWDERILGWFTQEDYAKIQAVFDKVIERGGDTNISYDFGELIEIDL